MIQFITHYIYLTLSLVLLLTAAIGYGLLADQRRAMMISALMSAPWAFASIVFVPDYWNPVRVACFLTGPEDIIFSFSNGVIVWAVAVLPLRGKIAININLRRMLKRACLLSLLGFVITMSLWLFGLKIITAVVISTSVTVALLFFWLCRDFRILCVWGAIGFTLFYGILICMGIMFFPHFLKQWNLANLSGILIFNVPIEEFIWAFVFGACWPLYIAYILDAKRTDNISSISPPSNITSQLNGNPQKC
jgi:hypothetical protein